MSLHRLAARRDDNEPAVVEALEAIGAVVRKLSGKSVPDLLVGFRGVTVLLGVKAPDGPRGGKAHGRNRKSGDHRPAEWDGGPWRIVTTPAEAVAVVMEAAGVGGWPASTPELAAPGDHGNPAAAGP